MDGGGLKGTATASISVKEREDFDKFRDEWDDDDDNDGIIDSTDRDCDNFNYILPKSPSHSISSSSQRFFCSCWLFSWSTDCDSSSLI